MSSAHRLTEVTILPNLNKNPFRGKGDMQRTRNAMLEHVTFSCDLDLWSAHGLFRETFLLEFKKNPFRCI